MPTCFPILRDVPDQRSRTLRQSCHGKGPHLGFSSPCRPGARTGPRPFALLRLLHVDARRPAPRFLASDRIPAGRARHFGRAMAVPILRDFHGSAPRRPPTGCDSLDGHEPGWVRARGLMPAATIERQAPGLSTIGAAPSPCIYGGGTTQAPRSAAAPAHGAQDGAVAGRAGVPSSRPANCPGVVCGSVRALTTLHGWAPAPLLRGIADCRRPSVSNACRSPRKQPNWLNRLLGGEGSGHPSTPTTSPRAAPTQDGCLDRPRSAPARLRLRVGCGGMPEDCVSGGGRGPPLL